ncbi:MAG TPA: response regulator transcription factor [Rubrobacter sp.]|nr:response regulator transcription factor [Rubrobacter sp.]
MSEKIGVMLVDDHVSFRQPLAFMLGWEPDLCIVSQAGDLAEARYLLLNADAAVDVAVVDLDLPDGLGIDLVDDLRRVHPRAVMLVLSAHSDEGRRARAIEAGAAGVMHKSSPVEQILDAIRQLSRGDHLLSQREVIEALRLVRRERERDNESRQMIEKLTSKEREVLQALAEGLSDKGIAERLYVGVGTVRTHVRSILMKLEVQSRLQALVFAVRHGLVEMDPLER